VGAPRAICANELDGEPVIAPPYAVTKERKK